MPKQKIDPVIFAEMVRARCSAKEICERFGVHPVTVSKRIAEMGLPALPRGSGSVAHPTHRKIDPVEFEKMVRAQRPVREIAEHFGINRSTVSTTITRMGLPRLPRRGNQTAERNRNPPHRILVDRDLFAKLYREGFSAEDIAERCGCSVSYVSSLAHRMRLEIRPPQKSGSENAAPKAGKRKEPKKGYARINEIAELQHVTFAEATRRYHRECGR